MKKDILFRIVFVLLTMIAFGWLPQPAVAQHGGHGGGGGGLHGGGGGGFHAGAGGGFHGGGGFYAGGGHYGYGGGHFYSGYRGGFYGGQGYYGGRGGYGWGGGWGYGRGGRYWGPGYGYGWGWGFGFGWPYWGWGYPYGYYYNPWYYAPGPFYSYPYYPSPDPNSRVDDPLPANPNTRSQPNQKVPIKSWGAPSPGEDVANANYAYSNVAALAARRPVVSVDRIGVTPSSYRATHPIPERSAREWASPPPDDAALRPEMQRALQRLREMPPFAREREIETGPYRQFSLAEKQILRNGALLSPRTTHDGPDSFNQRVSLK